MPATSWRQLTAMLRAIEDFLTSAIEDLPPEPGEIVGHIHSSRLLGHVTDARLLAEWIQAVGEAADTEASQ